MDPRRVVKHLGVTHWHVRRAFPRTTLVEITQAIERSERTHGGQIRFAVEGALHGERLIHGQSARERAVEVFSTLRMWDTEHRNGVLLYLLLADRAIEIVADRGAHMKVGSQEWQQICGEMQAHLGARRYQAAIEHGINAVTRHLVQHFPPSQAPTRELPDSPAVL
jgi:uncharacterized membrane protein